MSSWLEDVGKDDPMPDPLDVSPDASRQAPGDDELDPTGLSGITDALIAARQLKTAAVLAGFTDAEAFQLVRDYVTTMIKLSAGVRE